MQLDMHFYGVYALARAAGVRDETARKIAFASQFVDDSVDDDAIVLSNGQAILPTMTSHKPLDYKNAIPGDQWKVWVPFHFLPGAEGSDFVERMVCRKDSKPARKMVQDALDVRNRQYWPHLIGITAHVYADTFSHYGFVGFAHPRNKVDQDSIRISSRHSRGIFKYISAKFEEFKTRFMSDFAEIVPVGHGAVATYPDRPYLKWSFRFEGGRHRKGDSPRDNVSTFHAACKELYGMFSKFADLSPEDRDPHGPRAWKDISRHVKNILRKEAPKKERIKEWRRKISSGVFCEVTTLDREIEDDEGLWRPRRVEYECGPGQEIADSDACRFIRAAWRHREYVLHELLPAFGLTIY